MGLPAILASALSGVVAAVGWVAHRLQSFNVGSQAWTCLECQVPNELDRDTCWSCGAGYGQDPLYPSHIPLERRWICASCAVWNGIARTECWRCGRQRTEQPTAWPPTVSQVRLPGGPAPEERGPSRPREPAGRGGVQSWKRRET